MDPLTLALLAGFGYLAMGSSSSSSSSSSSTTTGPTVFRVSNIGDGKPDAWIRYNGGVWSWDDGGGKLRGTAATPRAAILDYLAAAQFKSDVDLELAAFVNFAAGDDLPTFAGDTLSPARKSGFAPSTWTANIYAPTKSGYSPTSSTEHATRAEAFGAIVEHVMTAAGR